MKIKLVAIAKDEAIYLPRWIFHHFYFGIDSIEIYINNTRDNSREIIDNISQQWDVHYIEADYIFNLNLDMTFQRKCYTLALQKAKKEGFTHIIYLDIDEFWTPYDFSTSIKECLKKLNNPDVLSFEWANKLNDNQIFSAPFANKNRVLRDNHLKSILKTAIEYKAIGAHIPVAKNINYLLADGSVHYTSPSPKTSQESQRLKEYFILHRLWRSRVEYISLLGQGLQQENNAQHRDSFSLKLNRPGYMDNHKKGEDFDIQDIDLGLYQDSFREFMLNTNLKKELNRSKGFIFGRALSVIGILKDEQYKNSKEIKKVLFNIDINNIMKKLDILGKGNFQNKVNYDKLYLNKIGDTKMKKIFQIGFNKSGSGSIHQFFLDNDILSIHWDNGNLSKRIHNNYLSKKPLLEGYDGYQAFTDMEHDLDEGGFFYSAEMYFKELDQTYPGSLFILNFRDIESWIRSRVNHGHYLFNSMLKNGFTADEIKQKWNDDYNNHIANVLSYFKERDNLLILELKKGNEPLLGDFLSKHGIKIKKYSLGHHHKTKSKNIEDETIYINNIRDAAVYFETHDMSLSLRLMKIAQELRPKGGAINDRVNKYESYFKKLEVRS